MADPPEATVARVVCRVLYDATRALPRYRMRTRLSLGMEARRRWADEGGGAVEPERLQAAVDAELERLVAGKLVNIGGPSQKRVQLNAAGKAYAAKLLRLK